MEDNLMHAVEMAFAVFVFVFAVSAAIFSYNRLDDTASNLVSINIGSRRGTAANERVNTDEDILRKTDYGEIVLSILNLPRTVMTNGNSEYANYDYQIVVNRKGEDGLKYVIKANSPNNELFMGNNEYIKDFNSSVTISANGSSYIFVFDQYVTVRDLRGEDIEVMDDKYHKHSANYFADYAKSLFSPSAKYHVSYTEDALIYTEI